MCGFVGITNLKDNISSFRNTIEKMNQTLSKRGPDEEGYFEKEHILLGHKRLVVIDPKRWSTTYV